MTAFADLTLNDGQSTPVAHTFKKVKVGDGIMPNSTMAAWEDRILGVYVGFPRISMQLRFPDKNVRSTKVTVKIALPVLENVSNSTVSGIAPAPTVAYTDFANIEVVLPERSTEASRRDLLAYIKNFVNTTEFSQALAYIEPVA